MGLSSSGNRNTQRLKTEFPDYFARMGWVVYMHIVAFKLIVSCLLKGAMADPGDERAGAGC